MQEQWNELLATALLGTEQRKCALVAPELEFLNTVTTVGSDQNHEAWVLLAGAFAGTYRRAGQIPRVASARLLPAPPESKLTCSAPVAARLTTLLDESRTMEPFVEEMLIILARQERIVPPALLPALLTWAQRNKQQRFLVVPVVGERGQWLTQVSPGWKNALQVDREDGVAHVDALQRITGQQALCDALSITDNIFSKRLTLFKGQGVSVHGRLLQLAVRKMTTLAIPGGTYFSGPDVSKIAVALPAVLLPELSGQLHKALARNEYLPWLSDLVDRLEFRQLMLEELDRE